MILNIGPTMAVMLKRVYDPPAPEDGFRVFVERLWPRGMTKERAKIDLWVKEAGASTELRKWYGHEPSKWDEFRRKYHHELDEHPGVVHQLKEILRQNRDVTLLFAAHDPDHNNALALKEYLEGTG
ncbi:MAG: DUF488 domain-containing protein [Methanoregulaceae archaeon]|nr:DUF488 domain-containing protein [Methanoregulaceae archaeon]